MKIALLDSGIGLLAAAAALRALRPDADLVLTCDPDGMPWGPRTPADVTRHALACARAAAAHRPDALVVACNTASVHALDAIRAELEPGIPVIGTVPAVKPAAAGGGPVAIWATPATTGSAYQRGLIQEFAAGAEVVEVPCPGMADAVERADEQAITETVAAACARTPAGVRALVLGCTHYELVRDRIRAALGDPEGLTLHGSAQAVAVQALRRVAPEAVARQGGGSLLVLRSGRVGEQLPAALAYPEGRLLDALATAPARP
ncbi:glutamate racemase [Streptacidiphilus sp. PB12-B1b]|uniref:glutamate racemase n=1 Tax=Streptacidiphilus sp. PB12-B1b TaxID=2705012 RepID=UPI0015FB07B3|nr:aspartate/glutamate racemase family protein [Streptacidiphilus sp. PB12-B1b]QMU76527.1 glutamate racemase [Streptacidiphilus sp. PB12-B1b]